MHNNHSIIRWLPLISRHTPVIAIMAAIHRDTERRQQCLLWPKPPAFVFVYSGSEMIYGFSLRCRCAVEPRRNVWWKITQARVALSPLKMQNSGVGKKKKEAREPGRGLLPRKCLSPISSPNSRYIILESWVQAERRECMCAHQNKASGASRWYVILRKPGGTFDLCAFREINPRVLSLLWEEQTYCNAVKLGPRMK